MGGSDDDDEDDSLSGPVAESEGDVLPYEASVAPSPPERPATPQPPSPHLTPIPPKQPKDEAVAIIQLEGAFKEKEGEAVMQLEGAFKEKEGAQMRNNNLRDGVSILMLVSGIKGDQNQVSQGHVGH